MDMDLSDIKIDDKPYLYEIMQQLTNGRSDVPQIFFNSKYIGGLTELEKLKDQGLLKSMIDEAKYEADPGPLYRVYRAQAELFSVCPPELYFPPPLNRRITCIIRLVNRTSKYTVYKLKTTSPKVFAEVPKQGFIPPNQVEKLEVMMNGTDVPLKQEKFRVEGIMLNYGNEDMKNMVDDVVCYSIFFSNPRFMNAYLLFHMIIHIV
jgi:glutaredoxin